MTDTNRSCNQHLTNGETRARGGAARRLPLLAGVLLFFATLLAPPAGAQLYTGSVAGAVTDPSGAVVPAASVTLVDVDRGYSFGAKTDNSGRYLIRPVPPGKYTLSVDAAGFQSQRKEGVTVDVNQNLSFDFSLKLATSTQSIEVSAVTTELKTQDAVTGQVVDRTLINDLPLINRGVFDLAFLAPGVTETVNSFSATPNNFISNGSRGVTLDILVDGVSASNFEQNSGIQVPTYTPSVDDVEEFKVQQTNFSAEYGFSGATVVNVVTRSGTNQFHGSAFDFLRNQVLDANDWFSNQAGVKRQPLKQNNFGVTVGGPVKKNRTFFFFSYDGTRSRTFGSAKAGVPTNREHTGDFGELCTVGQGGTFDPVTGICSQPAGQLWDPFVIDASGNRTNAIPNNDLSKYTSPGNASTGIVLPAGPGNLIDPVAAKLMALFPAPNASNPNWFGAGTNIGNEDRFDIKVDHRFNDANLFSARYSRDKNYGHSFTCFNNPGDPCNQGPITTVAHVLALNLTHTFSPSLVLSVSYGGQRRSDNQPGIQGDFKNLDPVRDLGLPAYMDRSGVPQYPAIILPTYPAAGANVSSFNLGSTPFSVLREGQDVHQLVGSLSWVRGRHELKFGGDWRMHRINFTNPGTAGGEFQFDFSGTSQVTANAATGGDDLASFLIGVGVIDQPLGNVCGNCVYEVPNIVSTQSFRFAEFVQDNWRLTSKLTLNIGLRYELSRPRTERFNRMNYMSQDIISPIDSQISPANRALLGGRTLRGGEIYVNRGHRYNYDTDYKDIQPRFGFAYQLPYSTVIRGGYGIYFSTPRDGAAGTGPLGFQGYVQQTQWVPSLNNAFALPGARLSDPYPNGGPKLPPGNSLGSFNDIGFDATGPIPSLDRHTPYEQSWSLGIQKELPWKVVADVSYVGKKGTHLYFGDFKNLDHLSPADVAGKTPADFQNLANNQVANPFQGVITDPNSVLSGSTVAQFQLLLPYPQYTTFNGDSPPIANSIYHSGQFELEKPFSNGLEFIATFVLSKSIDTASVTDGSLSFFGGGAPGGGTNGVQDPNNAKLERAASNFDISHVLQFSYVYDLPFGTGRAFGKNWGPVLNAIAGGWQTNGIWRFDNGAPLQPGISSGLGTPIPTFGQRPNLSAPLERNAGGDGVFINQYFSNAGLDASGNTIGVLSLPPAFTLGNAPRTVTSVRAPGTRNATLSLFKQFSLSRAREGMRLEYRLEAFNAFNHPHFAAPDVNFGDSTFGQITSTAGGSREVQMALKLYW